LILVCCLPVVGILSDVALETGQAVAAPSGFQITTVTLPSGTLKVPYTAIVDATGGHTPYRYSVVSGTLPKGLHLIQWMGFRPTKTTAKISGRPKATGTWTFTLKAVDRKVKVKHHPSTQNSATAVLSITIS